ncbi:MAG TPA: VWA domain-containing protein [Chloroflexota bacterium]
MAGLREARVSWPVSAIPGLGLTQPLVLLILVPGLALVLVAARARLRLTSRRLRIAVLASRLALVSLMVLALAQPTLNPPGQARAVVFALDVSQSLSPDQQAWARAWALRAQATLPPGSWSRLIEFGARAQLADATVPPPGDSTDLAAALRLAGSIIPREATRAPEIVLLSDGWQNAGRPPLDALPDGVAISYVSPPPPATGQHPLAVIHSLETPGVVRAGDRIDVDVELQAIQPVDGRLRVSVDGVSIADATIHLDAGQTQLSVPGVVTAPGFVDVRAELLTGEQSSSLSAVVVAKPAGHVLVLEDDVGQADALAALLAARGLTIEHRSASRVPPNASDLSAFDGIVLVNTPATSLSLDQQRTLQSFVQDLGRGLVVVGGPRTFSPGGYQGTVLDDLSPVAAEPPVEPQQGSLALFLVIDRSGSMDIASGGGSGPGSTKMAMAREAAIEAAGLLQSQDTLGVIAFDSAFQWVVPPTRLGGPDEVKTIQNRIATIKPGGGTSILPPLEAAFEAASNASARLKHIVLMTDGESNDRGYEDLLARMAPSHITLSTLAIGSDADTRLLTTLAHLGGGRYYFTERASQIPRIASKETAILTRDAIVEGQVAPAVADPSPILRSLSGNLPMLSGYVATTRKDRAVTALETASGHPLLAHWQYGLGRVVAWTSEAQQGWGSAWADWPDAAQFWTQAIRWALPAPVHANFQPTARAGTDGHEVQLSVQALADDGQFADARDTRATVMSPDGSAREFTLPQTGPGQYALDTRVSQPGAYRVLFSQGQREEVATFSMPDAVELHSIGANTALLDALAGASGGRALSEPTDLRRGAGAAQALELWPVLLGLALVLLPLDVFLRRRV